MSQLPVTDDPKGSYVMPAQRRTRFIAGIDPDLDKSGLVIYDRAEKAWFCKTLNQYELQETIRSGYATDQLEIVVEAGWENPGFHHYGGLPKGFSTWKPKSQMAYLFTPFTNVGENFGVGKSILHYFTCCGYPMHKYVPTGGKWDADLFKRMTGLPKGYNEEIRDAARALWPYI